MPNEEDRKWLYAQFKDNGYDTGSYDDFISSLDNDEDFEWWHNEATSLGLEVGDLNEFGELFRTPKQSQAAISPATEPEGDVPESFDDQPDLRAMNETARKSAEKEQKRLQKEDVKAQKKAQKAVSADRKAYAAMSPQERRKAFNEQFRQRQAEYAAADPEGWEQEKELIAENDQLAREAVKEEKKQREEQKRYGTGNEAYSPEEAAAAGKEFEALAPEIDQFDTRLAAFNNKSELVNSGKLQLTPDEYAEMQAEADALTGIVNRYENLINTAPGREYKAVSERLESLSKGEKTPENAWEYAQEFSKLQRNPLYRASMGQMAPSEDEIQSDLLQGQIAYLEGKMKDAKGKDKKELKKAYAEAKEALYANPYYKEKLATKIAENKAENEQIAPLMAERRAQLHAQYREQGLPIENYWQYEQTDTELQNLVAASKMHDDAIREYQKPTKYEEYNKNVTRGLADWAGDPDTWFGGLESFRENMATVRPVLEKVQGIVGSLNEDDLMTEGNLKALEEQLTPGELAVLDAYFEKVGAQAAKGADTSIGYQIGQGIGDMVSLGLEMVLTGGVGGAVHKGIDKAGMAAMKKFMTNRLYRKMAKSGVGRVALWGTHKIGRDVLETAARIPFMPSTYKALGEGSVELSSDYKVRPLTEYAPTKLFDQYVEQLTEVSNGFGLPLINRVVKTPGMTKFVHGMLGENGTRALRAFIERGDIKLLDDAMIGSFGGEWEEELLGAIIHSITDDPNALQDFFSAEQQLVLLGTLAPLPISRGAVGSVALGVPAAKAGISWNRAEKALIDAGFDEGRIARLKEVMDNAPAPEAARAVMEAYSDAYDGLRAVEDQNDIVRGTVREARLAGGLYDKLAHYYWDAQQKRAVGLMAEVEEDRKVRDKQAELKAQYGQFWYEDAAGNQVVERASMVNPAGGVTPIFITSNKYNSNDELPYVGEDGSTGFVNEGQFTREDPFKPATPLNEYLARLVMQDSQIEEAAQVINDVNAVNQTLRQQVESLPQVTLDGKTGHLTNPSDDMVTFVPDDESEENVVVAWETLAEQNGIGVPEVSTQDEKTIQDADVIAAREQAKAEIYDSVNDALNGGFDEAVVETEDGPANVVGILQDTIDPDEGTAQFVVQFPDGKRDVTSSIPIEPILAQLNGEENEEVAEEPETEPEAEPEEEAEEQAPKIPLDKNGNPIYDAPGVSVEDALADIYTTEGVSEEMGDQFILDRAAEAEKGRNPKQGKMSLREWGAATTEANRKADFWAELKEYAEENKKEREAEAKREAERQKLIDEYGVDVSNFDLTPQTLQEAVAEYLGGVHLISLEDALKHIQTRKKNGGIPAELIRHMGPYGIIASEGGAPIADVASDIVREFYGDIEHDEYQDEAFNYIVDFVRGNTKSEIKEFIFNQRLEQARALADITEVPEEAPKEAPAEPEPQPAPAPAPEPEPVEETEEDLPEEEPEPAPAPEPETEVQEPEKEEGNGEEKPENVGKTGEKSVPLNEGEDVPTTEREIRTAEEAKAFYEKQYGKGSARAINKAKLWEKLHAHDVKPSTNGQNKMALAVPEGYTEDEVNEIINLGAQEGKYLVEEDGKVKFPQFFKSLVESYGDVIRPFVKQIYGSTGMIVDEEFADQMDERKAVRAFDENIDLNDIDDEQSIDSVRDADGRDSTPVPGGDEGGVGEEGGGADVPADTGTPGENTEGSGNATDDGEDQGGEGEGRPADAGADSGEETEPVAGTVGGRGRKTDGSRGRGGKRGGTNGRGRGGKRTGGTESGEVGGVEPGVPEDVTEEKENPEETRETAKAEKEKTVNEETDTDKLETEKDSLKEKLSGLEEAEENAAERAKLAGELDAVIARLRELYKNAPKKLDTLEKEKVPYVSVSDPSGEHSIGSVVPSGVAEAMHTAMLRIEKEIGKPLAEFVRDELKYKSLDEMFSKDGKDDGLAGEQVDAVALSIYQMKKGRMFINGDMTGIGKGRVGAALIRWAKLNGKKCIFASDKPSLFTDMYRDITDIGSGYKSDKEPGLLPFIINDKDPRNKNKTVTILNSEKKEMVTSPSKAVKQKVFEGDGKSLPVVGESINRERSGPKGGPQFRGKQYDFVMMTYSQAQSARGAFAKNKLEWLKSYAKDAIIICDESHLAAGDSSRGNYFQDMVRDSGGVTFMSATFAKNPQCMKLYAIKSSMGDARMSNQAFIETVEKYGVPMQEFLAQTLIEAGEMVRRERDFTGVETTWTDPKQIYSAEEYKNYRDTNDKTVGLIRSIIQFQRTFIDPIIGEMNGPLKDKNKEAEEHGEGWFYSYTNTAYSSQVSNICNLMFYAMKAKKAADVAIEQMKRGEKSVIVVDNTLEGYIKQIEGIVEEPDFTAVFERGMKTILKYRFNKRWKKLDREESEEKGEPVWVEDEDKAEVQEFESIRPSFNEAQEQAYVNLLETVRAYAKDKSITKLTISPIDYIKELIEEAGFSCGEITGRKVQLVNGGGMYQVKPRETEGKDTEYKFNGGTAKNPLSANEQYDALIINSAAATGISLHASRRFGNQAKRNMIIVQPAKDQNVEVQVRGRIDRTGQVQRGSYIYITSPIPAEYKTVMMLRKKLASLDAQASGTADVSSNRVDADDMDNKYGDEVARDFLAEHPEINNQLDNPISRDKDKNSGEMIWKGRDGLLYQLLIGMQRMTCEEQEMILKNLQEQYIELVEYYEQNGTNELSSSVLDLDAVTIDEGVFVHGKDNSSISGFAHDTKLERIEANILKKPMASDQIYDKMRQLGAFTDEGKIDPLYGERIAISTEAYASDKKAELKEKHEKELNELLQTIRDATPQGELSDSEYEKNLMSMIPVVEMREKHKAEEEQTGENLDLQVARVRIATNNLKPGALMMVPLIDGAPKTVPYGPGRFIGFKVPKDANPKGIKAMFATKDSRSSIDIPVVKMKDMIVELVQQTEGSGNLYDQNLKDIGGSRFNSYITDEDRRSARDEWWDKRIPKNKGRSIRYIITGNLFQAGYNLGTQKKKDKNGREEKTESVRGKMCLFTKKDAETGRISVEQGMLLVDSFDPETFYVSDVVKKPDIWDSYDSVTDRKSNITAFRSGNNLILQFYKRRNEKIAKHPVFKDETMKGMMNEKDFVRTKDYIQCSVPEGKVEEALEHVYKEYGFTKDRLFIMPDSTERVDAIVPDTRPYKEIIDEYNEKYPYYYAAWQLENKITELIARHKADIENEDVIKQIKDLVAYRQAMYRKDYARKDTERLAWEALIQQGEFEKNTEDKAARDKAYNRLEAIKAEMASRLGDIRKNGTLKHYKQGRHTIKEIESIFNEFNKDKFNKEMAAKVFKKFKAIKEANIPIVFSEKIDNGTGGYSQGQLVEYNWKFFNADWISDQQKADTALHELVHTLTVYAKKAVDDGLGHLINDDMNSIVNELMMIWRNIYRDAAFTHDTYQDYGTTDWYEMLSETASNATFREDLKKVRLIKTVRDGDVSFSKVSEGQDLTGKKVISAYDAVLDRLNELIDGFNETALMEVYRGSKQGEMEYNRGYGAENLRNPIDRAKAITTIDGIAKKLGVQFEQDSSLNAKGAFNSKTGKIRINVDAHKDTADLEATLLHEAVAHYGLRKLFGNDWKELRKRLYDQATDGIKARVDEIAKANGLSTEVAMEEYIANLAEDGRFDQQEESFWQKVVTGIKRLLHKIGFHAERINDADLRAMLYASYRNLQRGGALESAARVSTYSALRSIAENSRNNANFVDNGTENDRTGASQSPDGIRGNGRGLSAREASRLEAEADRSDIRMLEAEVAPERIEYRGDSEGSFNRRVDQDRESRRLIEAAKKNGLFIEPGTFDDLPKFAKASKESVVRLDERNGRVIKIKDPFAAESMTYNSPFDELYVHIAHNILFPESRYKFLGITSNRRGDEVRFVLQQDYIASIDRVDDVDARDFVRNHGFRHIDGYRSENDDVVVMDYYGSNILKDADGYLHLIDPLISFKRNPRDIIDDYLNGDYDPNEPDFYNRFLGEEGARNLDAANGGFDNRVNFTIAKMMDKYKYDAKFIKMATGWERGADRKWRYEVPDDITIKPGAFDEIIELVEKDEYLNSELPYKDYDMEELFDAPELYKAYPEMRKTKIRILDMKDGGLGSSWHGAIDLNWRMFTSRQQELGSPTILSVITHEVQHEIQRKEGFAYGSWDDDYWSRTGEVEARNAAWRRNMTAEEIAQSLGEETEDIPRSEQSIGKLPKVWNAASKKFEDAPMEFRKDVEDLVTEQDTEELYRRSSQGATAQTAAQMYGGRVRTIGGAVHEVLVDELHPVDVLLDALSTESKTEIKDDERVSDRIRETGGKAMHAIRQYDKKFLQPLWSSVGEFRKKTGTSIKDTETYIGLKSGLERNEVLAKRDAKRDYQSQYDATAGEIDGQIKKIDSDLKRKIKALDKKLDEGKISDITYQGKVDELNAEAKTLKDKLQAEKDAAAAKRDGHFADVDAGTDERYQKYRKNDYSAITAWAETNDLEEAESLAGDYVADMESRAGSETTKELWKRINAATKETLKFQYEHDMLTRQQYNDISKMMQYYVPMRGFADDTAEDIYNYYVTPQGNDFQATVLTAKGRKTWYEGPLGNIGAMHSSAISQGIKNEAKLSLLDAVRRRPDNTIATVTRAWFVKNGQKDANGKDIYEVAYPQIPENVSFTQRQAIVDQFEKDMAEKKANGEAYNSHREVDLRGGVVAFERESHKNEHIVKVREGGKEYGVIINGNPAAAQAINGVRRSNGAGEKFLGIMRSWTRLLSSMFTTFSVPFWVSNFQRDHGQGLTNAFVRNKPEYVGRYITNRYKAFKLFPYIIGENTLDDAIAKGDRVAVLYKQYLENGGPMGQNRIEDNEYFERQMKRYLDKSAKQGIVKGASSVLNFIGGVGEAIETITRFAAFMTSMESGRSLHESISDAKEISTNFARKGSGRSFSRDELDRMTHADGTRLNAVEKGFVNALSIGVEICRATIPFFNAAVQGLENKVTNYREHTGKTLLADSIYLMLGLGMKLLLANAGGDDDKEKYSHTSDYLRRNNILNPILGDGRYVKWALPQEYRVMFALGDIIGSAIQQERPIEDLGADAFGALMQLSPIGAVTDEVAFSPENKKRAYETLITNAAPGVLAPVLESIFNMDFKGARIYNEGFNENLRAYPGWKKALPTTGKEYVAAAKFLNEISGGNEVERGFININPAVAEHLVESYFSGPYQIVVRLPEAAVKAVKGEATVRDVPLLNRIILNTNDNQRDALYSNMYYYFKELNTEAERINSEYKDRKKEGKVEDFYKSKDYQYLLVFKKYDTMERSLRKMSKTMAEKGDLDAKAESDKKLEEIHYRIAKECLDIYFNRNGVK